MEMDQENSNAKSDAYSKVLLSDSSLNGKNNMKRKKRSNTGFSDMGSFKMSILRTKKITMSNMKLGKHTLEDLYHCMLHLLETFHKELRILRKKGKGKKLAVKQMETVVKLCLPRGLAIAAAEYARKATDTYLSNQNQEK